jgi:hypothetical protein
VQAETKAATVFFVVDSATWEAEPDLILLMEEVRVCDAAMFESMEVDIPRVA